MATYEQLPGQLGLAFKRGDNLSTEIDFTPTSFTGQTVSASMYSVISGSTVSAFVTTMVNATAGQVNVSMTKTATAAIVPGTYTWRLSATDGTANRTYLSGYVEVS